VPGGAAQATVDTESPEGGTSRMLWILLALVVAAAIFFVLRGRA
jgi:hypothetical protein